ncbi:hypothetical protein F4808DRAFT_57290 [Astrocystis sublimbata]|nr:hypothetical protein F4808DRAFT_57290 [Astrocystis sublimbata]
MIHYSRPQLIGDPPCAAMYPPWHPSADLTTSSIPFRAWHVLCFPLILTEWAPRASPPSYLAGVPGTAVPPYHRGLCGITQARPQRPAETCLRFLVPPSDCPDSPRVFNTRPTPSPRLRGCSAVRRGLSRFGGSLVFRSFQSLLASPRHSLPSRSLACSQKRALSALSSEKKKPRDSQRCVYRHCLLFYCPIPWPLSFSAPSSNLQSLAIAFICRRCFCPPEICECCVPVGPLALSPYLALPPVYVIAYA